MGGLGARARTTLAALLLLLTPWPWLRVVSAARSDVTQLLAFKSTWANGGGVLASWNYTSDPCGGGWLGVLCDNDVVVALDLSGVGLLGTLSRGRWPLPASVRVLQLDKNNITGPIPEPWALPDSLVALSLRANQLSGPLPTSLAANAAGLLDLRLAKNRLQGSIPRDLQLPANLTVLVLSANLLTGSVPALSLPPTLQGLGLSFNFLTGQLPADWALPVALQGFFINNNSLSGTLPAWDLPQARIVVTPGNKGLCGTIPSSSGFFKFMGDGQGENLQLEPLQALPSCNTTVQSLESSSSSTAAVVGGVVGGLAGFASIAALVWCWRQRSRKRGFGEKRPEETQRASTSANSQSQQCWTEEELSSSNSSSPPVVLSNHFATRDVMPAVHVEKPSSLPPPAGTGCRLGVDVNRWLIPFETLQLGRVVGEGSFGRVYEATWQGTQVAVKLLREGAEEDPGKQAERALSASDPILDHLQQEASMMAALRHPNVLSFLGICQAPPAIVTEFCERGSLFDTLRKARAAAAVAQELTWARRLHLAEGAALGMLALHSFSPPLVHRDLKSLNLLIGPSWTAKVCDFNLSKVMGEGSLGGSSLGPANPCWLAPEVLAGESHTFASDVYSFGIILWELLTFEAPFEGRHNPWQVSKFVTEGGRPPLPALEQLQGRGGLFEGLGAYMQLMQRCWAQDPADRPTFLHIASELSELKSLASSPSIEHTSGRRAFTLEEGTVRVLKSVRIEWGPPVPWRASPC